MAFEWESDEWHAALRDMSATERVLACGHTAVGGATVCPDCGEDDPL